MAPMQLDQNEVTALLKGLLAIIDNTRYPLSPRVQLYAASAASCREPAVTASRQPAQTRGAQPEPPAPLSITAG